MVVTVVHQYLRQMLPPESTPPPPQTSNYFLQVSIFWHKTARLTRLHSGLRYEHLTTLE